MLTIFNGRTRSISGLQETVYIQLEVAIRSHIHLFKNGTNLNPFAIFMCLGLHTNENGWAFPSTQTIEDETGLTTDDAISSAIGHLRNMTIDGKPILRHYRTKNEKGQWGRSYYHIFPTIGGADKPPVEGLLLWDGQKVVENPPPVIPVLVIPVLETGGDSLRRTNDKEEPVKTLSGKAGGEPPKPKTAAPKAKVEPAEQHVATEKKDRPRDFVWEAVFTDFLHGNLTDEVSKKSKGGMTGKIKKWITEIIPDITGDETKKLIAFILERSNDQLRDPDKFKDYVGSFEAMVLRKLRNPKRIQTAPNNEPDFDTDYIAPSPAGRNPTWNSPINF